MDAAARQVAQVTYKLLGQGIKAALVMNPGKIILSARQSGKTRALTEYIVEQYPDGVILFCMNETVAMHLRQKLPAEFFQKSIIPWGNIDPFIWKGEELPIFADEFFFLQSHIQAHLLMNKRFEGAVSSANGNPSEDVKKRCIVLPLVVP